MKGRPSADGKTIGGKGRLTDQQIGKMQQYYGNAIRENKGDLVTMSVVEIVYRSRLFQKTIDSSQCFPAHL